MPRLSLCLIAKNEEANMARCLGSARKVADELIVVDTGSTDATPKISEGLGAQVFSFQWADDFSEARNFALGKTHGKWILWLDADEELVVEDREALHAQLEESGAQVLNVRMRHFYGLQPPSDKQVYLSCAPRIFRNHAGLTFGGRVHERLEPAGGGPLNAENAQGIQIDHYGYMEAERERKCVRNLSLLLAEWNAEGENPWLAYHIAVELHRTGKLLEAYQMVNEAIRRFLKKELLPPALLYKLKYETLVMTGHYRSADPAIEKAIALYPDYADLSFYHGLVLWHLERYQEAADAFRHCLALGDGNPKYLTLRGVGSYFALYYLGACLEKMGEKEAALERYRQALALYPESELFQARLEGSPA